MEHGNYYLNNPERGGPDRPRYLAGYTTTGGKRHAVPVRADDPAPLSHSHPPNAALCGAWVSVAHVPFRPAERFACKRCVQRVQAD